MNNKFTKLFIYYDTFLLIKIVFVNVAYIRKVAAKVGIDDSSYSMG